MTYRQNKRRKILKIKRKALSGSLQPGELKIWARWRKLV